MIALFVFSMQITNHQGWLKRPFVSLLYLEPILYRLVFSPTHIMDYFSPEGRPRKKTARSFWTPGAVFWLNVVYSYSLILIATILIVRGYLRSSGVYRRQLGVILLGIGFTWLNSIIFILGLIRFRVQITRRSPLPLPLSLLPLRLENINCSI